MDSKLLLRQFKSDPGAAFIILIKDSGTTTTLGSIRTSLVEAGAAKKDVDTKWKAAQPLLAEHPHVRRAGKTGYVWSTESIDAKVALNSLARERKLPGWLREALAQ